MQALAREAAAQLGFGEGSQAREAHEESEPAKPEDPVRGGLVVALVAVLVPACAEAGGAALASAWKTGLGQQHSVPWMTYEDGPGRQSRWGRRPRPCR